MSEQTTATTDDAKPGAGKSKVLARFAAFAFGAIIVITLVWTKVSPWTSYPIAMLSHVALEQVAPMWVRDVHKQPGKIEVETSVGIVVPNSGGRIADVYVEADPGRYAFGLPIFLALIVAAWAANRAPGRLQKALLGYLILLPIQSFSLVMYLLMQVITAANLNIRTLRVDPWQMESIVFGYQVGVLVLPTLAPVLVWLLLDRKFFGDVIVNGWKQSLKLAGKSPNRAGGAT
ncbi:exosortase H-associated membrane protein [Diaphorobacter sp.]|uniref:exosortase H-associated membrane protein n=1 Tax=Diaphorobacter sp. TaxID=1934310 RepID=UPI0028A76874|nr:exosortase H-associated membrane protein [Diaphorobacter sp.]